MIDAAGSVKRFRRSALISVIAVYLLIIAGGIVRSTGSGMGCPDWPRCFGRIIPPVHESQLPPDYKEKYKVHDFEAVFNPVKTWIEYVNRLMGAVTGLLVIWVFWNSFPFRKTDNPRFVLSGLILFLVIVEGLVGKYVVSTNLKPLVISIHMYGSILIILLLIYLLARTYKHDLVKDNWQGTDKIRNFLYVVIALTMIQIFTGTQVRQEVDQISATLNYEMKETWLEKLTSIFIVHRTFSWIIIAINAILIVVMRKHFGKDRIANLVVIGLVSIIVVEVLAGTVLAYFDFPAFIQPVHLLMATLMISLQFFLLYTLNFNLVNSGKKVVV